MSKLHFIRPGSGGRTFCGRDRQRVQYTISLQVFRVWRQEGDHCRACQLAMEAADARGAPGGSAERMQEINEAWEVAKESSRLETALNHRRKCNAE